MSVDSPLLNDGEIAELWKDCGGRIPARDQLESLEEEYCRLFIGPRDHLPPAQSVWTSGELQSSVVENLKAFVQVSQFESPWPELLPDHLANLLRIYAALLLGYSAESDDERSARARLVCVSFLNEHLLWVTPVLFKVQQAAQAEVYESLAEVTRTFLIEEQDTYHAQPK